VTIRNGDIESYARALVGDKVGEVSLYDMRFVGQVWSGGGEILNSTFIESETNLTNALIVRGAAEAPTDIVITNSSFTCEWNTVGPCVSIDVGVGVRNVQAEFRNNRITIIAAYGLEFVTRENDSGGAVTGNVITHLAKPGLSQVAEGMTIVGNGVVVAWNTIIDTDWIGIRIFGGPPAYGGNIIEGNIIIGDRLGIYFNNSSGNFFGNNRVSATTLLQDDLGGQVDWGGNVTF
jgi:parallel beta-helix repeat protein